MADLKAEDKQVTLQRLFVGITIRVGWIRFELDRQAFLDWLVDISPDSLSRDNIRSFVLEQPM